jgi:hypothetical protein
VFEEIAFARKEPSAIVFGSAEGQAQDEVRACIELRCRGTTPRRLQQLFVYVGRNIFDWGCERGQRLTRTGSAVGPHLQVLVQQLAHSPMKICLFLILTL